MCEQIDEKNMYDTLQIMGVVNRIGPYGDQKRWDEQQQLFMDEITVDFGAVKPPQIISAKENREWATIAYARVTTHHMLSKLDVVVDGDTAQVFAQGLSRHQRNDNKDIWHIYSSYEFTLKRTSAGWKVSRLKMLPIFEEGNAKLLEETYALDCLQQKNVSSLP
jgi:hypothetical protein